MATATATPTPVTTLQGHDHEFQYLKEEDQNSQSQLDDISPSDILAQLSAAEQATQSVLGESETTTTPTQMTPTTQDNDAKEDVPLTPPPSNDPVEETVVPVTPPPSDAVKKQDDDAPLTPPPAPVKKLKDNEFHYHTWQTAEADDGAESVEISHLIAQQEQSPPSPIPHVPEEEDFVEVKDDETVDEPFDCMPVDNSEEGILKRLEKVVQDSDRVLHPGNQYYLENQSVVSSKQLPMSAEEMAMMTPVRSGDPLKSPTGSDCGASTVTGTTAFSRASVKIMGKNKKPKQPIMKLRVNDSTFEPLLSVQAQKEDMPFDETTSHNFKTAIRNVLTATTAAAKAAALEAYNTTQKAASSANTNTPDTTLMEDSEDEDDDTTNYGDEDEWTADDTSKYTDGTGTDYTNGDDTYTEDDTHTYDTMETPMDEAPMKKSARARRRQKLLARARAVDKKSKEQQGWDEKVLDAVFSPGVTDTALEVADFLTSGAEVTISMTKGMLQDAVTQLEKEEREINGVEQEEEEEEETCAGESAYQDIAAAATGSNLQGNGNGGGDDTITQEEEGETVTSTTINGDRAAIKDPWDQPEDSFDGGRNKEASFVDLMEKGIPLLNRKLERMVNEWTSKTSSQEDDLDATSTVGPASVAPSEVEETNKTTTDAEDRVSAEQEEGETQEVPTTTPVEAEEEKKESEEDDDNKAVVEEKAQQQLELEDAEAAAAAEDNASSAGGSTTLSLDKPTKRLSV